MWRYKAPRKLVKLRLKLTEPTAFYVILYPEAFSNYDNVITKLLLSILI
jgi:hypothetical protein